MRTCALPNGLITNVVDVKAVRVHKHFLRAENFYVAIEFRNGSTEDVVTHTSREAADAKQAEITGLIREAWDEVEPYNYGYETGRAEGRSSGWSEGFKAGRSEGYGSGMDHGFADGRRSVLSELSERREVLMQKQHYAANLPPGRRRYLRNASFTPGATSNSER